MQVNVVNVLMMETITMENIGAMEIATGQDKNVSFLPLGVISDSCDLSMSLTKKINSNIQNKVLLIKP